MARVTIEQVKKYLLATGWSYKPTGVEFHGCPIIQVGSRYVTEFDLIDQYKRGEL